ncbi:opacity protein-like surface antigen [Litorimonas taeanensis]|uniref:Opacity protein-like surface antigen n=1 Tax=Litorimonas taeanensis TaxID=568099 RepID=A0A420WKP5_9PROT|nr:OmpA family protein [Litorimonas taeanensis]RKQ71588.1 opacity protein-like surface antigen [Litorimonas taeanensis]
MKQKLLFAAATAALMAAPSLASAQESGWYLRGNAGYGTHTDGSFSEGMVGDVESEGDFAYSLGLGYQFPSGWRLELDGTDLKTDLGSISSLPNSDAQLRTRNLMLNAIYDFNDFGDWTPYVGAGLGISHGRMLATAGDYVDSTNTFQQSSACPGATNGTIPSYCDAIDSDTNFGWQVLAGLGYAISDNLTWDTQYKYADAGEVRLDGRRVGAVPASNFTTVYEDAASHTLLTGFRYRFGAPAPVPAPLPVANVECWDGSMVFNTNQCPAEPQPTVRCWDGSMVFDSGECPVQPQTYTCWDGSLVYDLATCPVETRSRETIASLCGEQYRQEIIYYEFDKGQSAETRNTINRILDIGQYCNVDNIRVVGHTDSSGSAAYNLALSKRRAKDARDELVRQGVRDEIITSEGKGETELFVQTGDGVKEDLNRRTEVLISLSETGGIIN